MARRLAMSRSLVVALCLAAAVAGFALGRALPAPPPVPAPDALAAAVRAALGEGDALERLQRTTTLLEQLSPDNLVEVAAVYDEMRPVIGDWELRPFVAAWARLDPQGAFEHALGWPARGRREVGVEAALEEWATLDPGGARKAFEQVSEQNASVRKDMLRGLATGWARAGKPGLDGFIVLSEHQDETIGAAVRELVRKGGPEAVVAWVDPILRDASDRPTFKRLLFRISLRAYARWDPERAAVWAKQHAEQAYAAGGPLVVAGQWGGRDGAAALAWLRGLPAGEPRDRGVERGFARWLHRDPAAATAWLEAESPDGFNSPAIATYAEERVAEAPEEALGWCERIPDPEGAARCVREVAGRWYHRDAEAAEAWLQTSALDEQARNAVRHAPRPRRPGSVPGARAQARSER